MMSDDTQSFQLGEKIADMMAYAYPVLAQFPKGEKFGLAVDIKKLMDELLGYAIMARKSTNGRWYIAGLSALKEPLTLTLDLSDFGLTQPQLYVDNKKAEPVLTTLKTDKRGRAKVTIQPNGGIIIL